MSNDHQTTPLRVRTLGDIFSDFRYDDATAVYVDGGNLHHGCKAIDLKLDYGELKKILESYMSLRSLNYFASLPNDAIRDDIFNHARKLTKYLANNGWRVHESEATVSQGEDGKSRIIKANVDTDLAATAVDDIHCAGRHVSRIILVSGDKDFTGTVKILRRYARVTVLSTRKTLSVDLKEAADSIIYLDDLKTYVDNRRWVAEREALHESKSETEEEV